MKKGFLFYYFKQYVSWDEYGYRYFSYGNWLCSFNSMFKWDFRIFVTGLTIQKIFSIIFSPFAFLLGLSGSDAMYVAELMGIKITTNEFVAMMDLKSNLKSLQPHTVAVATTFLASFANFSTVGMIYGTYNSLFGGEKSSVIGKMFGSFLLAGWLFLY